MTTAQIFFRWVGNSTTNESAVQQCLLAGQDPIETHFLKISVHSPDSNLAAVLHLGGKRCFLFLDFEKHRSYLAIFLGYLAGMVE